MSAVADRKNSTDFGRRLRQLRESQGLTQTELGERCGMLYQVVARLERSDREPTWPTVLKLATALGVTPDSFLGDDQPDPDPAPEPPAEVKPRGKRL